MGGTKRGEKRNSENMRRKGKEGAYEGGISTRECMKAARMADSVEKKTIAELEDETKDKKNLC